MIPTDTQTIWLLAKTNGADNRQEMLPVNGWKWPKDGFLTRRLEELRKERLKEQGDEQRKD